MTFYRVLLLMWLLLMVLLFRLTIYFFVRNNKSNLLSMDYFFSLLMDVPHLVVDCQTLHRVWRTLKHTLTSSFNSRIIQLYDSF
jgi:membrane protein YdbS with pleckstrin-like domain